MRVLLIDIDSKMGNLALRKISAYHKKRGDGAEFLHPSHGMEIVKRE